MLLGTAADSSASTARAVNRAAERHSARRHLLGEGAQELGCLTTMRLQPDADAGACPPRPGSGALESARWAHYPPFGAPAQSAHHGTELPPIDGLRQIDVVARPQSLSARLRIRMGSERDRRNVVPARQGPHAPDQLVSIHDRHRDVAHQHVRSQSPDDVQCLGRGLDGDHLAPALLQVQFEELPSIRLRRPRRGLGRRRTAPSPWPDRLARVPALAIAARPAASR